MACFAVEALLECDMNCRIAPVMRRSWQKDQRQHLQHKKTRIASLPCHVPLSELGSVVVLTEKVIMKYHPEAFPNP